MIRPVLLSTIGRSLARAVSATPAELAPLAARLGIPAVGALSCRWRLSPVGEASFDAEGVLSAQVTQICVVTLEPFESVVAERFAVRFVPAGTEREDADPSVPDELGHDGVSVDLGEAAVEQLALALDPYPRRPDAMMPAAEPDEAADDTRKASPFAALARRPRD